MQMKQQMGLRNSAITSARGFALNRVIRYCASVASIFALVLATSALAQTASSINVITEHNDIARTGQNLSETLLTPATVNPTNFGKLFSLSVTGGLRAQPLYVPNVAIPGKGTHNVLYIVTLGDYAYAWDADTNGGSNAKPLWSTSLKGTLANNGGASGTPVIDLSTNTMYVVSFESQSGTPIFRMHALDITSGAEKFGGPVIMTATVPGTGTDSTNGLLTFDPIYQQQRPGLLELNGVVYVAFGSQSDVGAWHGWIFSFSASTLKQLGALCINANGSGGGIWMGGAGLAAEVYDPTRPYGRMFIATGNGSYNILAPTITGKKYSNPLNEYGMSVLDIDLTGGVMTVEDAFTPFDEALLDGQDGDLGSGGPVLLPTQTMASGKILKPLVEIGKSGMIYILDRDDNYDGSNNAATEYDPPGLGGFNNSTGNSIDDNVVQEVQTPVSSGLNWGAGVWGTEAYWNNNIYAGGTNALAGTGIYKGNGNSITAYSFINGVLSTTPTSQTTRLYTYPGPTPSVSANGAKNGIVWVVDASNSAANGPASMQAYDATNLANMLYSTTTNAARDTPSGTAGEWIVPTIVNGKVYFGALGGKVNVYGLLSSEQVAPAPVIAPGSGTFSGTQTVSITDGVAGAIIYYTTDGTIPTSASSVYSTPLSVTSSETITAIASPNGYLQSPATSATYSSTTATANPVFSLAGNTYAGAQSLTLTDSTPGAIIYYTTDGSTPSTASAVYGTPIPLPVSATPETVQAIAVASGLGQSSVISATYTITLPYVINFPNGFTLAQGPMQFNGSTGLDDFRLQLTNGGLNEAGSAFFATPVNVQAFTTDFTIQLSNPAGDGSTFTIQGVGPGALGAAGSGLGYAKIPKSVAIKFDIYSNSGEGPNSTGLYINGASPTIPAINLAGTGIDLHSGNFINTHITYDGKTLYLTLTDAVTLATWSTSFTVNIPAIVGGNTAYVGFTGGTGGRSSSQKVTYWTYLPGQPVVSNYPSGFDGVGLTLNGGAALNGTRLRLTDGGTQEARSAFYTTPVNVQQFSTSFNFQLTSPNADGFTFAIQGVGPTAVGSPGGYLGYGFIRQSLAVKFDLFSNAGEGNNSTGMYINGAIPTLPATSLTPTGINLHSGDIFNAQLAYDGTTLTVVIIDTVTRATATQTYTVNIPSIVGGATAYVGFTGGAGGVSATQDILGWTYSTTYSAPALTATVTTPSYATGFTPAGLTMNGGSALNGTRLRLTDGGSREARSAFFTVPVNVQKFSTSFNFQLTSALADGFTFAIQSGGPASLGSDGGGLGYAYIPNSVAVKFDLFSNAGEGPNSTGLYANGAQPTLPATDLTPSGISLHSGDIFKAQLSYDGATLTVVITDTVTNATASQSYSVNIPATVGGPQAYVGFTAGSGGQAAIQDILSWTYSGGN